MLFPMRKYTSSGGTADQLVHAPSNQGCHAETEMGEGEKFVSDAVGHAFPYLHQLSLYW